MPTSATCEELQSEYILPRQYAVPAFQEILAIKEHITPHLQISEIRTIAADQLWMSPSYRQDSVAIHFTWKKDWEHVRQVLPVLEDRLAKFNARPHWGKLFTMRAARLQPLYEKLTDFRQLLRRFDPQGKFRNAFLERTVFGDTGSSQADGSISAGFPSRVNKLISAGTSMINASHIHMPRSCVLFLILRSLHIAPANSGHAFKQESCPALFINVLQGGFLTGLTGHAMERQLQVKM